MKRPIPYLFIAAILLLFGNNLFAQTAPAISYSSPGSYTNGNAITPLVPNNTGGAVPPTVYGTVTTVAGTGSAGFTDGTGTGASFNGPLSMVGDASGNLYIVDFTNNAIRKCTPLGVVTTFAGSLAGTAGFANGTGTAATFNGPNGITADASGNLYIADQINNAIRKITPAGVVSTFATGLNGPAGLIFNPAGTLLYVAEQTGNDIKTITLAGVVSTYAGSGTAGLVNGTTLLNSRFNQPVDLNFDASGNLFVMDYQNNVIRKITGTTVTTFAGSATGAAGYQDGTGTAALFSGPYGMSIDGANNLYIGDNVNNVIRKVSPAGVVTTFAGTQGSAGFANGTLSTSTFNGPLDTYVYTTGICYMADYYNDAIRQIQLSGYTISPSLPAGLNFDSTSGTISGTPTVTSPSTVYTITAFNFYGSSSTTLTLTVLAPPVAAISYSPSTNIYTNGSAVSPLTPANTGGAVPATTYSTVSTIAAAATGVNNPRGIAVDGAGNIYEADNGGNVIYKITGGVATIIAGSGTASEVDGNGIAATFNKPTGIVYDGSTYLYIVDNGGNKIRRMTIASPYTVLTIAGSGTAGETTNTTGTLARFNAPYGIAYDGTTNLYVTDFTGNTIRKISTVSPFAVTNLATTGLSGPAGIVYDGSANLYVANATGNTILKVTTGGTVSTFAGSGTAGSANGTGAAATFKTPYGITFDASKNLTVADEGNFLIRTITVPGAVVTTLAGITGVSGDADGIGTAAGFAAPYCITADQSGNVFVGDNNAANSTVRQMVLTGFTISPTLPAGLSFDGTTGTISGTPTITTSAIPYTVTAYNAGGSAATSVTITVAAPTKPIISYSSSTNIYPTTVSITTLTPTNTGGTVPSTTYGTVSTIAAAATGVNNPRGIAVDGAGNIYEADNGGNVIYKITGGVATIIAGSGTASEVDGNGIAATFNKPTGIVYDGSTYLYIVDNGGNKIRRMTIASPYTVLTIAGSGTAGETTNTTGTLARFNAPYGIAYDGTTNLYVTDFTGNTIRKISTVSPFAVTNLATTGLSGPAGIVYDGSANLYVANATGNTILKVTTGGTVSTFAGVGGTGAFLDGPGASAKFSAPYGVTFDASKNLIVADEANNRIRTITVPGAIVSTLAGSGTKADVDGVTTAAQFFAPYCVNADKSGNIFVGDNNAANSTVRQITLTGFTITPALPAGLLFDSPTIGTGTISGTPTAVSPTTVYTVTAYNSGGSNSATVSITVSLGLPAISYTTPDSYVLSTVITPPTLSNTGGSVSTFSSYGTGTALTGATLSAPYNISIDNSGNIYVANSGNGTVSKYLANGTYSGVFATGLTNPVAMVFDASNNCYILGEAATSIVYKYNSGGTQLSASYIAGLNVSWGMAIDNSGNLYFTNISGTTYTVKEYNAAGTSIGTTLTFANLNSPTGITIDAAGNCYILNGLGNGKVYKYAGTTGAGTQFTTATFGGSSYAINNDAAGNIYIGNSAAGTVSVYNSAATSLASLTGLTTPRGVEIDSQGYLYVASNTGNTVTRYAPNGGYFLSSPLPTGLALSTTTGVISGTPTVSTPATNYTITAWNSSGSGNTVINITCYSKFQWKGTTSNDWNTGTNWVGNIVPGTGDQAQIGATTQAITNLPIIPNGGVANVGSILLGTLGNKAAVIEVDGTGVLTVTGDITYQSDASSLTNTAFATGFTSVTAGGTIKANNLNIIANTTTLNTFTEKLNSSVTNLNLSGNLSLTSTINAAKIYNSTFTLATGTTMTVGGIQTSNAAGNTSTFTINNNCTLNLTGAAALSGLATLGTNTIAFNTTGVTVGYTGSNNQAVYTDAVTGLTSGVSYTNIAFSGTGIKTATTGNLNISGNFTNTLPNDATDYIDFTLPTVNFNGTAQALAGGANNGTTFYNTTFSGGGTKTLNTGLFSIASAGVVTLSGSSTLAAGTGLLTLNSDTTGSATVAAIPSGSSITGTVNVQRFISGGTSTYRGYRSLSSPVTDPTSPSLTPYYNLSFLKGSGTYLTGAAGGGFDATGNATILLYNQSFTPNNISLTTGVFRAVTAINNATHAYTIGTTDGNFNMSVGNGYFLFFRGNNSTNISAIPNSLTFNMSGTLNQGQYTVNDWYTATVTSLLGYTGTGTTGTNSAVRGFNLVGNPYPSSIDWHTIYGNLITVSGICCATNLSNSIYVYNTVTKNYSIYTNTGTNTGTATGAPGGSNIIPSGQGFFVQATGPGAQLIFNESAKISSQPSLVLLNAQSNPIADHHLRLQLFKDSINKDETVILFNPSANAAYVQEEDGLYLQGTGQVNISNMTSDGKAVGLNQQPFPKTNQYIGLNVIATSDGLYQLKMTEVSNISNLFDVWLKDAYMKDSLDIKHNPSYSFRMLHSDTASVSANRFKLVIRPNLAYTYQLLSFSGAKTTGGAQLNWTTQNEDTYTAFIVQRSVDEGKTFKALATISSNGTGAYAYLDTNPAAGENEYRLQQQDINGVITYSNVVLLLYPNTGGSVISAGNISIYPNPVKDVINITITSTNNAAATYAINIITSNGDLIRTYTSAQATWQGNISNLRPGVYVIKVVNNTNKAVVGTTKFIKL